MSSLRQLISIINRTFLIKLNDAQKYITHGNMVCVCMLYVYIIPQSSSQFTFNFYTKATTTKKREKKQKQRQQQQRQQQQKCFRNYAIRLNRVLHVHESNSSIGTSAYSLHTGWLSASCEFVYETFACENCLLRIKQFFEYFWNFSIW